MKFGYTINNKLMMNSNGKLIGVDPYNPLNLPQGTIRVRTNDGQPPVNGHYNRATLVEGTNDVYDVYNGSSDEFIFTLASATNVIDVLGVNGEGIFRMESTFRACTALSSMPSFDTSKVFSMNGTFQDCSSLLSAPFLDTSNVLSMSETFMNCTSLTSVPLYDTSNVTDIVGMMHAFANCSSLTSVPLFDTRNVINMDYMFFRCVNVQSGALALYQQASSQTNVTSHYGTFRDCGINTQTGSAELAQIPSDWK